MNEALIGVFFGAILTYILNYLLEKRKFDLELSKYSFDIKRQRLEELYILIENSVNFSAETATKMYSVLYHGLESTENQNSKRNADDFHKLTNIVEMYFSDDDKLKELINKASKQLEKGQNINAIIMFGKNNDKDKLRVLLANEWKLFGDILLEIKKEIPRIYKELIQVKGK